MTYNREAVRKYQSTEKGRAARRRCDARPERRVRSPAERERRKRAQIFTLYGVTKEQYDAKLSLQGGHCFFCPTTTGLHIDHCHSTGKFRGLLCVRHNTALGVFGDTETGILCALEYLRG